MSKTKNKVKPEKVHSGDIMAFTYYAKVNEVKDNGKLLMVTGLDNGKPFQVQGDYLITDALSADQFTSTKTVSMTEIAEALVTSFNRPLTVTFTKQDGKERTLRGRLMEPEALLGRSYVEDLEATGDRIRLVDHRTIKTLVVDGVKYVSKAA